MTAALCVNVLLGVAFAAAPPAKPDAPAAKKPGVKVTISKATTYITEPLRADGYVDYVAALNQRGSQGVTPENNAAVLFWQAMGPGEIPRELRNELFKLLGVSPLPDKGDYFVSLDVFAKRLRDAKRPAGAVADKAADDAEDEKLWEQCDLAGTRPWSKQEFSVLADWLAANEKALALLVEASRRPRRFDPWVDETRGTSSVDPFAVLGASLGASRAAGRSLASRAMLRLGEGKLEEAWEDLLACHRLARLAGQNSTLVEALVAEALDSMACVGDRALLEHARLSGSQIAKMRQDLDRLPPLPKIGEKIDFAERYLFLDDITTMARDGLESLKRHFDLVANDTDKGLLDEAAKVTINWNRSLRLGNFWYDRVAEAYRKPTRASRKAALGKIDEELSKLAAVAWDEESRRLSAARDPTQALSQRLAEVLVTLFVPAFLAADNVEDQGAMRLDLVRLAFALAAYRVDRGSFPAKLAELAPKYLAEVPRDVFTGADLHYAKTGNGYLLYSVGINGKDDGGRTDDDRAKGETWDDLTVRMP